MEAWLGAGGSLWLGVDPAGEHRRRSRLAAGTARGCTIGSGDRRRRLRREDRVTPSCGLAGSAAVVSASYAGVRQLMRRLRGDDAARRGGDDRARFPTDIEAEYRALLEQIDRAPTPLLRADAPTISDSEYDDLERRLRELETAAPELASPRRRPPRPSVVRGRRCSNRSSTCSRCTRSTTPSRPKSSRPGRIASKRALGVAAATALRAEGRWARRRPGLSRRPAGLAGDPRRRPHRRGRHLQRPVHRVHPAAASRQLSHRAGAVAPRGAG